MATLHNQFINFHDKIKLTRYGENAELREKRDLLINELRDELKDEKILNTDKKLTFKTINQGSYEMGTGIKPINDDYDIDVGIIFDITNEEYDSGKLKKLIFDKLNKQYNRTVEYNKPCITVDYKSKKYHVDLAIYSKNNNDIHIAWGKEYSNEKIWFKSEPEELTAWVSDVSENSEISAQFKRCVKYLKKWKERKFNSIGNDSPPSIGITIQARLSFSNGYAYSKDNDLIALINIVKYIKSSFNIKYENNEYLYQISLPLPVEPYKNVYYKMSSNQQNNFYQNINNLLELLEDIELEESEHEASKMLRKIFGEEFELVEDVRASITPPYIITGQNA